MKTLIILSLLALSSSLMANLNKIIITCPVPSEISDGVIDHIEITGNTTKNIMVWKSFDKDGEVVDKAASRIGDSLNYYADWYNDDTSPLLALMRHRVFDFNSIEYEFRYYTIFQVGSDWTFLPYGSIGSGSPVLYPVECKIKEL